MYVTDDKGNLYLAIQGVNQSQNANARNLQNQINEVRYDADMIKQQLQIEMQQQMVHTLQMDAQRRMMEGQLILNGMAEVRSALERHTVGDNDQGGSLEGSRPPLKQLFDEINAGKLQQDYLSLCNQYVSFVKSLEAERIPKEKP